MINLNPEIVDQEKIRKLKRKRLLKIAFIPTIILFLTGLFFLRTGFYNVSFNYLYDGNNIDNAEMISSLQNIANTISPYLVYYNSGVINLRKSKPKEAEYDFRNSLKHNPPKQVLCKIYVNLSLSVELQADQYVERKDYDGSLYLYNKAETILYENNCADRSSKGEHADENAGESKQRILEKRSQAIAKMNELEADENDDGDKKESYEEITPEELKTVKDFGNIDDVLGKIRNGTGSGESSRSDKKIKW